MVRNFNAFLSTIDRMITPKISNDTKEFNNIINQKDLINIYRTVQPTTAENIFFSSTHKTHICGSYYWNTKQISTNFKQVKSYKSMILTKLKSN